MPTLTLMIGCPGSGKSTIAKQIRKKTGAVIVSTDAIRGELFGDEGCQDDPVRVFKIAYERIASALFDGKDVYFDATNLHRKDRNAVRFEIKNMFFEKRGIPGDIKYEAVLVRADLETCLRRNANRNRHVPEDRLIKMWQAAESISDKQLEYEGYAVTVVNNSDEKDYNLDAYNDGYRDAENSTGKVIVSPKYKGLVMAALKEAYEHELLGSIGDRDACGLYHRLKYEDYCKERGIDYDDMTEDDFEIIALHETEESERELE